ncbi:MAG: hypothetical protein QNK79_04940, partial [Synechococcus sp. ArSW.bin.68]
MSVRSGAGGASASTITLPLAWAADTVPETVALITELHQMVSNGYELRDALARVQAPAVAVTNTPSSPSRWTSLVEKFQADLQITNGIKPKTWKDNYGPFLAFTVEQLAPLHLPLMPGSFLVMWLRNCRTIPAAGRWPSTRFRNSLITPS